jgi:DNA-binding GntR family transcriptional regulator
MASFDDHCRDCLKALGEPFEEVNRWLDAFFPVYGFDHRPERHHEEGIEEVRALWGDRAAEAARIHIQRDYGFIPTKAQADEWKVFRELFK